MYRKKEIQQCGEVAIETDTDPYQPAFTAYRTPALERDLERDLETLTTLEALGLAASPRRNSSSPPPDLGRPCTEAEIERMCQNREWPDERLEAMESGRLSYPCCVPGSGGLHICVDLRKSKPLTNSPRFSLGECFCTTGALQHMSKYGVQPQDLLDRHNKGDWGSCSEEDAQANEDAIEIEARILSFYRVGGAKVYVITTRDRSVTKVILAEEY